jgi:Trp operon repressor
MYMAHVAKYSRGSCRAILEHDTRTAEHEYKNPDIDKSKTHLNWSLVEADGMTAEERLNKRLSEIKVQKRKDVNVLCSWVVTLPEDVKKEDERKFFETVYSFLEQDVGGTKNVISADVHYDESRPHLHFTFVPVVANTRKYKNPNKQPKYTEKCCADELLTRAYLKTFHERLDNYLSEREIKASIRTGKTTFNRSIAELKAETAEKQKELSEIAENNAREAIEIHRKAEVLDKQNNTLETLFLSLSEQKIKRKKTGLLGTVKLSEQEYEDLCAKADAVGNLQDAYTRLRDSTTGKELERLYSINEQLEAKAEKLEAKTENLQKISQELQQENRALKEETGYLREKVSKLENWVKKAKFLTEKVWLFAYRLVKSFDEPEVKDEAINLSEELYQNSMISLGEKLTRSRSRGR